MNIVLFDDNQRVNLLPLCFTRPCGDLRIGILTVKEKWEQLLDCTVSFRTQKYLESQFPLIKASSTIFINGRLLPDTEVVSQITALNEGEQLVIDNQLIAMVGSESEFSTEIATNAITYNQPVSWIGNVHDVFSLNDQELRKDFALLTAGKISQQISSTNTVMGSDVFLEEGATVEASVLNSTTGPIYIGKNATIMEGCLVRGGLAMCDNSTLKMGAKIYGATTIGPHSKVGGEVNNVVFHSFSNKGHDGFLGNAAIGAWCNLGADTNSSNLKNNYAEVKLWNYNDKRFIKTGLQFCGLIMGDHSKCGINTMFNTGTVVGVSANIFGSSFPRNFIPSFTWGGASGFATYSMGKAMETAARVMERRNIELTEEIKEIYKQISLDTSEFRFWESRPIQA